MAKKITAKELRKKGIKETLIPGILFVSILGAGWMTKLGVDIYKIKSLFPSTAVVRIVEDGDTLELFNDRRVRLIGINAPDRGEKGYVEATKKLSELVLNKKVYLEYDRYQDDQNGRALAWVWIGCEKPKFEKSDYMRLTFNRSREGLVNNPKGCEKGKLVQEELVKAKMAVVEVYKDRGELKYEVRLRAQ